MFNQWFEFKELSRWAKLKWILLLAIVLVAAFRRFSLPSAPFADLDVRGYLNPVVNAYQFHFLGHSNARCFVYPLFVLVVTWLADSLHGVTIGQHLLGLVTGVLIFMMWEQPFIKGHASKKIRWVAVGLQLVSTAYFLLATGVIIFEHTIRPESTAIFVLVLTLFLLVRNLSGRGGNAVPLSVAVFLGLGVSFLFPRGTIAGLVVVVFVLQRVTGVTLRSGTRAAVILVPMVLVAILLALPERYLISKYDRDTDNFGMRQFFYSHADIGRELIASGFNKQPWIKEEEMNEIAGVLVPHTPQDAHFRQLGFNPDELMYGAVSKTIDSVLGKRSDLFYGFYDGQIVVFGLGKYISRVAHELFWYYAYNSGFERIYLYEHPAYNDMYGMTEASFFPEMRQAGGVFAAYRREVQGLKDYSLSPHFAVLNVLYFILQITFLPTVILFAVVFVARRFFKAGVENNCVAQLGTTCWLMLGVHFGLVAMVALVHTFGIERYGASIFGVALLTQLFCGFYLVVMGVGRDGVEQDSPG